MDVHSFNHLHARVLAYLQSKDLFVQDLIGGADKEQVTYMVRAFLALDHDPRPDHASDALAAAITHAHLRDHAALERLGA